MAKVPGNTDGAASGDETGVDRPVCGLIMPISGTTPAHTTEHWAKVQKLLHRSINVAGFEPINVWLNSSTDRVSERIIGNIFQFPVVIVDISDLNPNVMLELGMRLASKKPTVVVVNDGGTIPFDIRDFHAIHYPGDMNMLGMEEFFTVLEASIREKYTASLKDNYTPFLGHIVVDVLSPQERVVGINELIIDRMDSIERKIANLSTKPIRRQEAGLRSAMTVSTYGGDVNSIYATVPRHEYATFNEVCQDIGADKVRVIGKNAELNYCAVEFSGQSSREELELIKEKMRNSISEMASFIGIREDIYDKLER